MELWHAKNIICRPLQTNNEKSHNLFFCKTAYFISDLRTRVRVFIKYITWLHYPINQSADITVHIILASFDETAIEWEDWTKKASKMMWAKVRCSTSPYNIPPFFSMCCGPLVTDTPCLWPLCWSWANSPITNSIAYRVRASCGIKQSCFFIAASQIANLLIT